MIINMVGGGGGAALNFKVVPGLTQPGTAAENTIWVKTERIGAWYFSATQPEGMQEWDVWFPTGTESVVEFNALRKNAVQVYPLSANQYVSGALVGVDAMSYQDGEWVEWSPPGALYWRGNQCTDVTGGWAIRKTNGSNLSQPTCTFGTDTIKITSASGSKSGVLSTSNKIDLKNAKTLIVDIVNTTNTYIVLYVGSAINDTEGSAATKTVNATGIFELDVSGVSGSYYVGFYIRTDAAIDAEIGEVYYE